VVSSESAANVAGFSEAAVFLVLQPHLYLVFSKGMLLSIWIQAAVLKTPC